MNLHDVKSMAIQLMDKHGLLADGWKFEWSRAKKQAGLCTFRRNRMTGEMFNKRIKLSSHIMQQMNEEFVRDTILHEIAHALTPGHNHDYVWKAKCREIGAKPERCFKDVVKNNKGQWAYIYADTGEFHSWRYRRSHNMFNKTWRCRRTNRAIKIVPAEQVKMAA